MEKSKKGTRVCSNCNRRKPLSAFLLSTAGYTKNYSNICKSCRLKLHKKAISAEDEDEGGKSGGLKVDYNAKLFEFLKQQEQKEAREEDIKEAHEETEEAHLTEDKEKQTKDKDTKSRTAKTLIEQLANLLSRKKSDTTAITNVLYNAYQANKLLDGISTAGTLTASGPEFGKRMAIDLMRFSGFVSSLRSLSFRYFEAFGGKITEADRQADKSIQPKELHEVAKEFFEPHAGLRK